MGQNVLGQSNCRIFKLTASPEHNDEKGWFFAFWYILMEIKSWLKNVGVGLVKNGCDHFGLKLAVSQNGINGINWFWCVDKNSGNPKVTLIIFGWWWSKMGVVF